MEPKKVALVRDERRRLIVYGVRGDAVGCVVMKSEVGSGES